MGTVSSSLTARDQAFTAASAESYATIKTAANGALSTGILIALILYFDKLLHEPSSAQDRAELVTITCIAIVVAITQIIIAAIIGGNNFTYRFPLHDTFMNEALLVANAADTAIPQHAQNVAYYLSYQSTLPQGWTILTSDLYYYIISTPTNLEPGDVLAFRYLCVFIFTPNNFLGYSHKLDRFYKSHRCRIGGQSRLQDLVRTIAPAVFPAPAIGGAPPPALAGAAPQPSVPPNPMPTEAYFIKGWANSANKALFALNGIQAVLIGFLGGKGFGIPNTGS